MHACKQVLLFCHALLGGAAGLAQQKIGGGEALRPVRIEAFEGASLDEIFELPAIEAFRIEPARKIEQILVGAMRGALGNEFVHRLLTDALDGGERIADSGLTSLRIALH